VYTALKVSANQFQLIVPPVAINDNAKLVLRDGTKKYEYLLKDKIKAEAFEPDTCYPISLNLN
jgi:hypothetical protein